MATGNGTSEETFTRAVPASDAGADDLAGGIAGMIDERTAGLYARLATVSTVNAGDARIAVQFWDEAAPGVELKARIAGVTFDVGDTVLCQPLGPTEWVVTAKMIVNNADRATVGLNELRPNSVRTASVLDNAITPAKLDRAYTTPEHVENRIATRVPVAPANDPVVRQGTLNGAVAGKSDVGHRHTAAQITAFPNTGARLDKSLNNVRLMLVCLDQNLTGTKKQPCIHLRNIATP